MPVPTRCTVPVLLSFAAYGFIVPTMRIILRSTTVLRIIRVAAVLLVIVAVSLSPASAAAPAPLRVVATFLPMYLFTANVAVGVPSVTVDLLLPASLGCPHDYALTPGDMRKISGADLIVANGLGMEEFLGAPIAKANPKARVVETAKAVQPMKAEDGHGHGGTNPHTWVSPRNAALQVRVIEQALSEAAPDRAPLFKRNADAYVAKLTALAADFDSAAKSFKRRNIVTVHNVFDYLARDLSLKVVGEIEETPGQEPSAAAIRRLAKTVRAEKVPAVFAEPQYPEKAAAVVAREAGVPVRTLDPVATGPTVLDTYETVMRKNLKVLVEALSSP